MTMKNQGRWGAIPIPLLDFPLSRPHQLLAEMEFLQVSRWFFMEKIHQWNMDDSNMVKSCLIMLNPQLWSIMYG